MKTLEIVIFSSCPHSAEILLCVFSEEQLNNKLNIDPFVCYKYAEQKNSAAGASREIQDNRDK